MIANCIAAEGAIADDHDDALRLLHAFHQCDVIQADLVQLALAFLGNEGDVRRAHVHAEGEVAMTKRRANPAVSMEKVCPGKGAVYLDWRGNFAL